MIDQKLEYIHDNPVQEWTVQYAEEYLYSSARNYAGKLSLLEVVFVGSCVCWKLCLFRITKKRESGTKFQFEVRY